VKVGKVNIWDNFDLATQYRISSIPRVFLFKGGSQPVDQVVGFVPESQLVGMIKRALGQ
jgi:thioredoxin-like negative regulator of GroEL